MLIGPAGWLAGAEPFTPCGGAPVRRQRCIVASTSATVSNVNFHFSSITTCGEPLSWFGDLGDVAELLLKCQMAASRLFRLGRDHSVAAVSRGGGEKDISSRCQTRSLGRRRTAAWCLMAFGHYSVYNNVCRLR